MFFTLKSSGTRFAKRERTTVITPIRSSRQLTISGKQARRRRG